MRLRHARWVTLIVVLLTLSALTETPAPGQVIRSGPTACRGVALTFDMCPVREGSGYDEGLVRMLIERHIPATFFFSGRWIAKHDEQVRTLLAVPYFDFGTHGQVHAHLPLLDATQQRVEIEQAVALLHNRYDQPATLFRPPFGEFDDTTVEVARALGLQFILWNIVSGDPDPRLSSDQILESVASKLRNGAIVVFHANGKGQHTKQVVERLYEQVLVKDGLRPVTVSELVGGCGNGIEQR